MATSVDPSIRAAFAKFDADGSGDIDVGELASALREVGMEVSQQEAVGVLRKYAPAGARTLRLDAFDKLAADLRKYQAAQQQR